MVYGSIYGASRIGVSEGSFDPKYAGPDGPDLMVQEAFDFEQKMFDIIVEHDFLECAAMQSVEMESALIAVDESFVSDMWDKIKELIKKIKDKIVSIAKAAAVKLNAFFTKDNAALVDRYQKQFDAANKSKIEIKGWRELSGKPSQSAKDLKIDDYVSRAASITTPEAQKTFKRDNSVDKLLGEFMDGKHTSMSSFNKDFIDYTYKSARNVKADTIAGHITETLTNYGKTVEEINGAKNDFNTELDKAERTADDEKKKALDAATGDDKSKDAGVIKADCAKYILSEISKASGKFFSALLNSIKFDQKQCRSAFVKIASKGAYSESAELMEEEAELQDYEVDSFFDQYSYDYEDLIA